MLYIVLDFIEMQLFSILTLSEIHIFFKNLCTKEQSGFDMYNVNFIF